jgi:hypothetical protein
VATDDNQAIHRRFRFFSLCQLLPLTL